MDKQANSVSYNFVKQKIFVISFRVVSRNRIREKGGRNKGSRGSFTIIQSINPCILFRGALEQTSSIKEDIIQLSSNLTGRQTSYT